MVDIQPLSGFASVAAATSGAPNVTIVPLTVSNLSVSLQNLTQSIQITAIPTALTHNLLTLSTALGDITVGLPQIGAAAQQNLVQQLMTMLQGQRAVTLSLQPGAPAPQAALLMPTNTLPAATTLPVTPLAPVATIAAPSGNAPLTSLSPLAVGQTFQATVLPALLAPVAAAPSAIASATLPFSIATNAGASSLAETQPVLDPSTNASPAGLPASETVNAPSTTALTAVPFSTAAASHSPQSGEAPSGSFSTLSPSASGPMQNLSPAPNSTAPTISPAANPVSTPLFPLPSAATIPQLLQPGSTISLQISAIIPPPLSGAPPPALPSLAADQIAATVQDAGPAGAVILKAGDATLFIKAQPSVAVGSTLLVTVGAATPAPLFPLPVQNADNFLGLSQIAAALAQTDAQALQQMMLHIPQPNDALPGALLLLFSAFRQASARGVLGEAASNSLIASGKSALIDSLTQALTDAGQTVRDNVVGEWKTYPLPLYAEAQFQSLNLYVHHDRNARPEVADEASRKTRFVIDMRLSRLGNVQIDGFVQSKKMDMVLRSEKTLPAGLPNELRAYYIKAMGAVGYTGSLNFQTGRQYWLTMRQPAAQGMV